MVATGKSLVAVYDAIKKHGTSEEIHVVAVLRVPEEVAFIEKHFP